MKVGISFIIISILTFLIISCNTNEPVPLPEKPAGYQDDVPWPSLADSPWPMNYQNPQSTGRADFVCNSKGRSIKQIGISWDKLTNAVIPTDSTILVYNFGQLFLYNTKDFSLIWQLPIGESTATPVISALGNIFTASLAKGLISVSPTGNINWESSQFSFPYPLHLTIDPEGNILFITGNAKLFSINKDGNVVMEITHPNIKSNGRICFSPNGKRIYVTGDNPDLTAIDLNSKQVIWSFGQRSNVYPLIDSYGNIFVSTYDSLYKKAAMYKLNQDGIVQWKFDHYEYFEQFSQYNFSPVSMDKLGNVYFGQDTLYSLDHSGNLNWKVDLNGRFISSMICDAARQLFLITEYGNDLSVHSISKEGYFIWEVNGLTGFTTTEKFAVMDSKRIYIPTYGNNFYIIE